MTPGPIHPSPQETETASTATPGAVLVILNLPVPDDRRAWAQAETLRDDGAQVTVVCPAIRGKIPGAETIEGIDVVSFRSFEGTGKLSTVLEGLWTTFAATRAAKRALGRLAGPRVLQVGNPPDMLFGLLAWARRKGYATAYDQRDAAPVLAASRAGFSRLAPFFRWCEGRALSFADVIVTPSYEQRARIRELYDRDSIIVRTAEVADEPDGPGTPAAPRVREGEDTVLGYLGVIGEQDGVGDLIACIDLLRRSGVGGFRVEIAGDGPALPAARREAERLGLGDVVRFRGWLGRGEVESFLGEIDAMLVPDPDVEFNHFCAMNKVTHAMARAIPVVLRPLRENVRIVSGSGIVAQDMTLPAFSHAITELLELSPEARTRIGVDLRTVFDQELSWSIFAPRYVEAVSPVRRREAAESSEPPAAVANGAIAAANGS
jgi:glycosyltransferase involved in cell wall biosynthesis